MKNDIVEKIYATDDVKSLLQYLDYVIEEITPYSILGIDREYLNVLSVFQKISQELLDTYDTPDTHQADDIYWLLYWAIHDESLINTFNGYNYLHMLLLPEIRAGLDTIPTKDYIISIIKLIREENIV